MPVKGSLGVNCKICSDVARVEIEIAAARGVDNAAIARKYGRFSKHAVRRHMMKHVTDERRAQMLMGPVPRFALAAQVHEESQSLLDNLRVIRAGLYMLYHAAIKDGDRSGASLMSGRLHENLALTGKVTGELAQSPLVQSTVNIMNGDVTNESPDWRRLETELLGLMDRHPELAQELADICLRLTGPPSQPAAPALPAPANGLVIEHEDVDGKVPDSAK